MTLVVTVTVAVIVIVVVKLWKMNHLSCRRKASLFLLWTSSELCSIHGPTSGRRDSTRAFWSEDWSDEPLWSSSFCLLLTLLSVGMFTRESRLCVAPGSCFSSTIGFMIFIGIQLSLPWVLLS